MTRRKTKLKLILEYVLAYTLLFATTLVLVYGRFWKANRSFVWQGDGIRQHYTALVYYGSYLRQIIRNLIFKHTFCIPAFDLKIGYGTDVMYALHYYVIGDPLALLSVFVPQKYTEYLYQALILLRIFLAGLSFSYYCISKKRDKLATLVGAIVYCFCGYVLYAGVRHPYFLNPMIYLPLILCGIDKIFNKKKPYLFIISVALAGLSNFYFFYMISIFMFLYAIIIYFKVEKGFKLKSVFRWLVKFISYYTISFLLASPILLPIILAIKSSHRIGIKYAIPVMFDEKYYQKLVMGFCGFLSIGSWCYLAYTGIAILSVIILFTTRKKNTLLKIGFVIGTVFLCIPYIGHVINGFSYVSERWTWAYSLLIAYVIAVALPEIQNAPRRKLFIWGIGSILWIILELSFYNKPEIKDVYKEYDEFFHNGINSCILILILFLIFMLCNKHNRLYYSGILICTIIGIFINANLCYESDKNRYMDEFLDEGSCLNNLSEQPSNAIGFQNNNIVRYEQLLTNEKANNAMLNERYSTAYYFSLADDNITSFMRDMYLLVYTDFNYKDLDGRSILEMLASVKYFVIQEGNENMLPYTFRNNKIGQVDNHGIPFSAYETNHKISIGKTFYGYIPTEKYKQLGVLQKQEALLSGVVMDHSSVKEINPSYTSRSLDYKVSCSDGVKQIDKNAFEVTSGKTTVSFLFHGLDQSETYLILKGMKHKGEKEKLIVKVKSDNLCKRLTYFTNSSKAYSGIDDFLINMGYTEEGQTKITVKFPEVGVYSFENIQIGCQPVATIEEKTQECLSHTLQDVQVQPNCISGTIELDQDGILLMSVPYSLGFKAYVDGKKQKIKKADIMYMALELSKGKHQIELKYTSPNVRKGFICFCIGIILFAFVIYKEKQKII